MSHFFYLIFYLLSVILVRRQTWSSRITRARDFWPMPYKGVDPSLGSLLRLSHQPLFLLDILHTRQPLFLIPTQLNPLLQSPRPRGHHVIPQGDGGIQDVLLQDCQVKLLRRIGLKPTPQNTHGHLHLGRPPQHRLILPHQILTLIGHLEATLFQGLHLVLQLQILRGTGSANSKASSGSGFPPLHHTSLTQRRLRPSPPQCHDFRRFSTLFLLSPKRPLI